ncbi:family 43 glycosylhydrolase [Modestobacter marinus]|uniref:family 43 glycosylhydrolase n=1 Tax=Modestobacter marinus TaxID=477641 RepID=UPI001C93DEC8|nr:family 43 glycosylhydrolase [Modestobacter marinus]
MSDRKIRHVRAPRRRRVPALALALLAALLPQLVGVGAAHADISPYGRSLAVEGLADPDIYKVDDNLYFMSGTSSQDFLPIYTSTDLLTFSLLQRYDPDALDPDHRYCREWAPELNKQGSDYVLYFVASRVDKDDPCPSNNSQQTIFYATAPATTNDMQFGAPHAINENTTHPRTYETKDCPDDGCENAMRLDPSVYSDGARLWLHYTWFDPAAGTVVSAFPLDAPEQVFEVTRPSRQAEQKINEAPTLFSREGRQYLFYSQGNMKSNYGMQYFMGAQVSDLTREQAKHSFSSPLKARDGRLIENQGHNTVTDRHGQFYTLYHVARFTADGDYAGRDVYVQPLMFKADGSLNTLNTVALRWSATAGSTYSLDVQTRDGVWIPSCMSPGSGSSVTFNEVCTGADDQVVRKADVAAFRINRITDGQTAGATTLAYDGYTDTLDATV